jgi:hypothetical protein
MPVIELAMAVIYLAGAVLFGAWLSHRERGDA